MFEAYSCGLRAASGDIHTTLRLRVLVMRTVCVRHIRTHNTSMTTKILAALAALGAVTTFLLTITATSAGWSTTWLLVSITLFLTTGYLAFERS